MERINLRDFSVYWASIIIGAGILTLPLKGSKLGFLPLFIIVSIFGFIFYQIYMELTNGIYEYMKRKAEEKVEKIKHAYINLNIDMEIWKENQKISFIEQFSLKKQRLFDELAFDAKLGNFGIYALFIAMFFYIFFADIGYILIGFKSLNDISEAISIYESGFTIVIFLSIIGLIFFLFSIYLQIYTKSTNPLHITLEKMLRMGGIWLFSICIIFLVKDLNFFDLIPGSILFGLLFYSLSILSIMTIPEPSEIRFRSKGELREEHKINVYLAFFEIILIIFTVLFIFYYCFKFDLFVRPRLVPENFKFEMKTIRTISEIVGLVIFAYVGTAVYNLSSYSELFKKQSKSKKMPILKIAFWGTMIPTVMYLGWSFLSSITLDINTINYLNTNREYTTIGFARIFRTIDPTASWLIALVGYLFALFAVTSACNGFTETLGDRISITISTLHKGNEIDIGEKRLKIIRGAVIIFAMICALLIEIFEENLELTKILDVAGFAGGGLLLLVLPWFLTREVKHKKARHSIGTIFIILILIFNLMLLEGSRFFIKIIILIVTLISFVIGLVIIWKE